MQYNVKRLLFSNMLITCRNKPLSYPCVAPVTWSPNFRVSAAIQCGAGLPPDRVAAGTGHEYSAVPFAASPGRTVVDELMDRQVPTDRALLPRRLFSGPCLRCWLSVDRPRTRVMISRVRPSVLFLCLVFFVLTAPIGSMFYFCKRSRTFCCDEITITQEMREHWRC
jgi:hypothetical protein